MPTGQNKIFKIRQLIFKPVDCFFQEIDLLFFDLFKRFQGG